MTSVVVTPTSGRPSARVKAAHLLVEGRVRLRLVRAGRCWATVNGDTAVYTVGCSRSKWFCDCECVGPKCSHIIAVQAIVDLSGSEARRSRLPDAGSVGSPDE